MSLDISNLLQQSLQPKLNTPIQLKLNQPLPPGLPRQNITLQVVGTLPQPNGKPVTTLQLPDGRQVQATLNPPLPVGTTLQLPANLSTTATTLTARLLPSLPTPPANIAPNTVLPNLPATATLTNASQALATAITAQAATQANGQIPVPVTAAPLPQPLPAGPISIQLPPGTQLPPEAFTQPVKLILPNPTDSPGANQTATFQLPNPITVTLNTGTTLPPGTTLTVSFPAPVPASTTQPSIRPTPPIITATLLNTTTPPNTESRTPNTVTPTPPQLATLKVLLSPQPPATPGTPQPTTTQLAGRILAPLPAGTESPEPLTQPILLANGQQAVLQWPPELARQFPGGLQPGSVIVADINPINPTASLTKVDVVGGQTNRNTPNQPETHTSPNNPRPASTPAPISFQPGTVVTGTITTQNPARNQVTLTLQTPPGAPPLTIQLNSPQQLPLGTTLTVRLDAPPQITGTPDSPTPAASATIVALQLPAGYNQSHAITALGQNWNTLTQALQTLTQQAPHVGTTLHNHLPQLAALLPTLLPYIEAIMRNSPERAFGREAVSVLQALGIDFSPDFTQLQNLSQGAGPESWRGVLFPYIETTDGQPRQGSFFWRRQKRENDTAGKSSNTRFIVQLGLSTLGEIQLDGLLSYPDLWLKLRRQTALEPGFVENLQTVVQGILLQTGLNGGIAVEVTSRFEVDPVAEILAHHTATLATEA